MEGGNWSIAGFMERRSLPDGSKKFTCHIAILSVGASIHESLSGCSQRVATALNAYSSRHAGVYTSETLRTVMAVQDTITRDPAADADQRGGFGFQAVMSLLQLLGASHSGANDARLSIISGAAGLVVRSPYLEGRRMAGPQSPRTLWFNGPNTDMIPPDVSHVFDLRRRFAGTIITLSFSIDPVFLNETLDGGNRS